MAELAEDHVDAHSEAAPRRIGLLRIAIGAVQGLLAWLLLELSPPFLGMGWTSARAETFWSQQHPMLFAMLALVTAFVPIIALAEVGRMAGRRLAIYMAATAAVLAALAMYDIWREPVELRWDGMPPRIWPSAGLLFCSAIGLFIVNQLIEHRERGLRLYSDYAIHFEDSWMRGVQLILSLIFTLLVWGVLQLGSALFGLIGLDWFEKMIGHNWFRCPVLGLAFAASIHITDVRPLLLRGMRNLGLTLLSWLLPLVTLLGCGFLLALLFTGLGPLWKTRMAASILMWSAAVTLLLLNAAYKDGERANAPPAPVRWAGRIGGPLILAFTLLAAYALALRIGQYGVSQQRVLLGAVVAMGLVYGAGYSWATIDRNSWLKRLERVNLTASIAILGVLALLLSPFGDPARLAVNSQVARLHGGEVASQAFDYAYLRFQSGRYGTEALANLTRDDNADIASRARVMQGKTSDDLWQTGDKRAATEAPLSHATVYPLGAGLPEDFKPDASPQNMYASAKCLTYGNPCDIIRLGHRDDRGELLLIYDHKGKPGERLPWDNGVATVLRREAPGKWRRIGTVSNLDCPGVLDALRKGESAAVRPLYDDFEAHGLRLPFTPDESTVKRCSAAPKPTAKPASPADSTAPAMMGPAFGRPGGI